MFKKIGYLTVLILFFTTSTLANMHHKQSIWPIMRDDFHIQYNPNREEIRKQIQYFSHNKSYFYDTLKKAGPLIFYIVREAKKNDLPTELALIPFIESEYDPTAISYAGASGLWQFMPQTAHCYGLTINSWYDDRNDIEKSTESALKYLSYLNNFFDGNWLYAIAAYDSGEGKVLKTIRKNMHQNRSTYFWNLDLPHETRAYIPKLLALVSIIDNPEYYGFKLPYVEAKKYFEDISIPAHIPMGVVAGLSSTSLTTLHEYNSGYKHDETGPRHHNHILLPENSAKEFKHNLSINKGISRDTWDTHKVKHGETLSGIAKKHHTTVAILRKVNHMKNSRIFERQKLIVPITPQMMAARMRNMKYTVQDGDSLYVLAHRFGTTVSKLKKANHLASNTIRVGHVIIIK